VTSRVPDASVHVWLATPEASPDEEFVVLVEDVAVAAVDRLSSSVRCFLACQ